MQSRGRVSQALTLGCGRSTNQRDGQERSFPSSLPVKYEPGKRRPSTDWRGRQCHTLTMTSTHWLGPPPPKRPLTARSLAATTTESSLVAAAQLERAWVMTESVTRSLLADSVGVASPSQRSPAKEMNIGPTWNTTLHSGPTIYPAAVAL